MVYLSQNKVISDPRIVKKVTEAFVKLTVADIIGNTETSKLFHEMYALISQKVGGLTEAGLANTTYLELIFLTQDFFTVCRKNGTDSAVKLQRIVYLLMNMLNNSTNPICNMLKSVSVNALYRYLNEIHRGMLTVAIDEYDNVAFRLFYHIVNGDTRNMTLKSVISNIISLSRIYIVPWNNFNQLENMAIDIYRINKVLFFDFFRLSMYNRWDGRKYMNRMGLSHYKYMYPFRRKKAADAKATSSVA